MSDSEEKVDTWHNCDNEYKQLEKEIDREKQKLITSTFWTKQTN